MIIHIHSYPPCVEPTVGFIEARVGPDNKWGALPRLRTADVLKLPVPRMDARHFFGDNSVASKCSLIVGYDAYGELAYVITIGKTGLVDVHTVPTELSGRIVKKPSVRLVFKQATRRNLFISHLGPATLACLAEPPRSIDVGVCNDRT